MKRADTMVIAVNRGVKSNEAAEAASIVSSEVKPPTRRYVARVAVRMRQPTIARDTPDSTAARST